MNADDIPPDMPHLANGADCCTALGCTKSFGHAGPHRPLDTERAPQPEKVILYDPMITSTMYECYFCKKWATKDKWIPLVVCPWCKKKAPTGEEFRILSGQQCLVCKKEPEANIHEPEYLGPCGEHHACTRWCSYGYTGR